MEKRLLIGTPKRFPTKDLADHRERRSGSAGCQIAFRRKNGLVAKRELNLLERRSTAVS